MKIRGPCQGPENGTTVTFCQVLSHWVEARLVKNMLECYVKPAVYDAVKHLYCSTFLKLGQDPYLE